MASSDFPVAWSRPLNPERLSAAVLRFIGSFGRLRAILMCSSTQCRLAASASWARRMPRSARLKAS